jgi:hypothetical protein
VFILVEGRRWFIPAAEISAKHSIVVAGNKWGRFEIEPGRPLTDFAAAG